MWFYAWQWKVKLVGKNKSTLYWDGHLSGLLGTLSHGSKSCSRSKGPCLNGSWGWSGPRSALHQIMVHLSWNTLDNLVPLLQKKNSGGEVSMRGLTKRIQTDQWAKMPGKMWPKSESVTGENERISLNTCNTCINDKNRRKLAVCNLFSDLKPP